MTSINGNQIPEILVRVQTRLFVIQNGCKCMHSLSWSSKWVHSHGNHIRAGTAYSVRMQCRLLHCAGWGIDQNIVPLLFDHINRPKHTAIQQTYDRWRTCLREYVLDRQEDIKFGDLEPVIADNDSIKFDEFEFDTTSMRRTDLDGGVVNWMDYNILYRRGHAASPVTYTHLTLPPLNSV